MTAPSPPGSHPETLRIPAARLLARPGHAAASGTATLVLAGGRIEAIEPGSAKTASGDGLLAMPALANAHDHGRGLRSIAVGAMDAPLELWIGRLAAEPQVDPYLRAATAFARMAESGICATNHCHNTQDGRALLREAEGVARAAAEVGIHVAFAVPFAGRNPIVYGDDTALLARLGRAPAVATRSLAQGLALVEQIASLESPTFSVQYGPVGPQWAEEAALEAIAASSAETGRRIHMHLFETQAQRQWADAHYKGALLSRLDRIGLLTPRLTLAHAIWLRPDEMVLLAERGVSVSLNASSNLRLRSGLPPVHALRRAGVAFGIGLDGMSLDDDEDMLREIRLLRHLGHAMSPGLEGDALDAASMFDAALIDGRRTIHGDDGGGRLAIGAPADILLLDVDAMLRDLVPPDMDIAELLLARMSRRHVRQLFVGGRRVVQDGACVTVDRAALEAELSRAARAAARAPVGAPAARVALEEAVADFYACGCHRKDPDTALPQQAADRRKKHHGPKGDR